MSEQPDQLPREPKPLTNVQRRMLVVLSDGFAHREEELIRCLKNGDGTPENVACQVSLMRLCLRPEGKDIVLHKRDGQNYYAFVQLQYSPYNG